MGTEPKRTHPSSLLLSPLAMLLMFLLLGSQYSTVGSAKQEDQCNGSMEECGEIAQEFLLDSEASERVLKAATRHIGFGVLKADTPACRASQGMPYTGNCLPAPSNPRSRGCSKFYRCRPGT